MIMKYFIWAVLAYWAKRLLTQASAQPTYHAKVNNNSGRVMATSGIPADGNMDDNLLASKPQYATGIINFKPSVPSPPDRFVGPVG